MEPLSVHESFVVPLRFLAGVVAGVVATLGMDLAMARLPEGTTPPSIASGVLTGNPPGESPGLLATVVHYLAGLLTGPLFVWLLYASEGAFGPRSVVATVVSAAVLYVLMVGFFAVVVLPRSLVRSRRVGAIRRDWAVSAAVYVAVLVPLVTVASRLL